MKITTVRFDPDGDGVVAMYVDGKLHTHGDWYHIKVDDRREGFIGGVNYLGVRPELEYWNVYIDDCRDICDLGDNPPAEWPDGKYSLLAKRPTQPRTTAGE